MQKNLINDLSSLFHHSPPAIAKIRGNIDYPNISANAYFYQTNIGVLTAIEAFGLPSGVNCDNKILGLHIHSGESCTGNESDPFANAKTHYNPQNCMHPHHAGDMPPLFSNNGYAMSVFLTNRFTLDEIIGKTVIIHSMPDDFTTQPAGNAGRKIACGVIKKQK